MQFEDTNFIFYCTCVLSGTEKCIFTIVCSRPVLYSQIQSLLTSDFIIIFINES